MTPAWHDIIVRIVATSPGFVIRLFYKFLFAWFRFEGLGLLLLCSLLAGRRDCVYKGIYSSTVTVVVGKVFVTAELLGIATVAQPCYRS